MPKVTQEYLDTRYQQILEAAITCFTRNGFHETTMDDICREAALSPGAIYRYFSSKEEIIEASCQASQQAWATIFEVIDHQGTTLDVLDELVDVSCRRLEERSDSELRLKVELIAEALRNPRVEEALFKIRKSALDYFKEVIRRGQAKGEVNAGLDSNAIAQLYTTIYDGLTLQKTIDPNTDIWKLAEVLKALLRDKINLPSSEEVKQLDVNF
jgi:AcrR family transcriptional regulator